MTRRIALDPAAPVLPGEGAGGVLLGDTAVDLRAACLADWRRDRMTGAPIRHRDWRAVPGPVELQWLTVSWRGTLDVRVNVLLGRVGGVRVHGAYAGRLWGDLGLGTPFAAVLDALAPRGWQQDGDVVEGWVAFRPRGAVGERVHGLSFLVADPAADDDLALLPEDALRARLGHLPVRAIDLWDTAYAMSLGSDEAPGWWRLSEVEREDR